MKDNITINELAADVGHLALELNNIAITLAALIEVLKVDRAELLNVSRAIFEQATREVNEQQEEQEPAPTPEQHIAASFNAQGTPKHPDGAVIFGG